MSVFCYSKVMFGLAENDNNQTDVGACCCLLDYCDRAMFMVSGEQVGTWAESDSDSKTRGSLTHASQAKNVRAALPAQKISLAFKFVMMSSIFSHKK